MGLLFLLCGYNLNASTQSQSTSRFGLLKSVFNVAYYVVPPLVIAGLLRHEFGPPIRWPWRSAEPAEPNVQEAEIAHLEREASTAHASSDKMQQQRRNRFAAQNAQSAQQRLVKLEAALNPANDQSHVPTLLMQEAVYRLYRNDLGVVRDPKAIECKAKELRQQFDQAQKYYIDHSYKSP